MDNSGIELKDYNPKSEVYTCKNRKTTYEERIEIITFVLENDMDYKSAVSNIGLNINPFTRGLRGSYQMVMKLLKIINEVLKIILLI